jgi:hypothetical protein
MLTNDYFPANTACQACSRTNKVRGQYDAGERDTDMNGDMSHQIREESGEEDDHVVLAVPKPAYARVRCERCVSETIYETEVYDG